MPCCCDQPFCPQCAFAGNLRCTFTNVLGCACIDGYNFRMPYIGSGIWQAENGASPPCGWSMPIGGGPAVACIPGGSIRCGFGGMIGSYLFESFFPAGGSTANWSWELDFLNSGQRTLFSVCRTEEISCMPHPLSNLTFTCNPFFFQVRNLTICWGNCFSFCGSEPVGQPCGEGSRVTITLTPDV